MITYLKAILESSERDEAGFTTAELLGNAALAVFALAGIWLLFQGLGADVIQYVRDKIFQ